MMLWLCLLCVMQPLCALSLREQFERKGYAEICDTPYETGMFDALYVCFDEFIRFLHRNPVWERRVYQAKERFIRSPDRQYYATDFFGWYDESDTPDRSQISFYYATHFHEYIRLLYPECAQIAPIARFFEACFALHTVSVALVSAAARALGIEAMVTATSCEPALLLKVVKYLPEYRVTRPHYDGTALSLFLDSTNDQALLLSPYKTAYTVADFSCPARVCPRSVTRHSLLLIPGTMLTTCAIYPTPHLVVATGNTRYATIAFVLTPYYTPQQHNFAPLPSF